MELGDQPLCNSDDGNIGKLQALEDCRDVLLITANPVQRLRITDIKPPPSSVVQKLLNARS